MHTKAYIHFMPLFRDNQGKQVRDTCSVLLNNYHSFSFCSKLDTHTDPGHCPSMLVYKFNDLPTV